LPTSPDHATSFHSDEWNGALGSEPLNARVQRENLNATPVSDVRHDSLREGYTSPAGDGSVKDKLHSITDKAHEKLHETKESIRPVLREKVDAIRTPVRNKVAELRPEVDEKIHTAKQSSRSAVEQAKSFLRRNPAILPGITTAVGLVAGMMARRALRRRKPLGVVIVEPKAGATAPVC
ncbi:MAG TPA: hypothetical protein VMS98_06440, partial [Thermoanaerobaculia bacterium]|nr:hypothetical protein [Thermoanaerobaculia bacterium]